MLCVTSYWVYCLTLKAAELAAKLPFFQAALWEKKKGTALSGNRAVSVE